MKNCPVPIDIAYIGEGLMTTATVAESRGQRSDSPRLTDTPTTLEFTDGEPASRVEERASTLGAKGPLIIFMFGVAAVMAFGVLGKIAMDESPQAQAWVVYREHLMEQFSAHSVAIRTVHPAVEVHVVGSADLAQPPRENEKLRSDVLSDFLTLYKPDPFPETIEFISYSPGGGCQSEREIWRETIDLESERNRVQQSLSKLFGRAVDFQVDASGSLRVETAVKVDRETASKAARLAGQLWGRDWELVQLRCAGRVLRYLPDGSPYIAKKNSAATKNTKPTPDAEPPRK